MTRKNPFGAAQTNAAEHERNGRYDAARECYAPWLGEIAVTAENVFDIIGARTQTARLFVAEALKTRHDQASPLITQGQNTFVEAMRLAQDTLAPTCTLGLSRLDLAKKISSLVMPKRLLAGLNALAVADPSIRWSAPHVHREETLILYESAFMDALQFNNPKFAIDLAIEAAHATVLVGEEDALHTWSAQIGKVLSNVPANDPQLPRIQLEAAGINDAGNLAAAQAMLSRNFGV